MAFIMYFQNGIQIQLKKLKIEVEQLKTNSLDSAKNEVVHIKFLVMVSKNKTGCLLIQSSVSVSIKHM